METAQIFQIILYVSLSILALVFVVFLIKLIGTITKVNGIIEKNRTEIDITMRKLPDIMENVEGITDKTVPLHQIATILFLSYRTLSFFK